MNAEATAPARSLFGAAGEPQRWAGQQRFVVLETGFGGGHNFLAAWAAWRADAARCEQLVFIVIVPQPPRREDLARAHQASPLAALAAELQAAWPPLTPNLHVLDFDGGRVRLLLALGEVRRLLPQVSARVDAFHLDDLAPHCSPKLWDRRLIAGLARLAGPQATVAAWSTARELHDGLRAAGFAVDSDQRDQTIARYAPGFTPRRAPVREAAPAGGERHALVIGAGIAGACAAASLARLGWRCTGLDRHTEPAQEASGNPAGLFHGTAHASDGVHARLHRAAALLAARRYAALIESGRVPGACSGLLRVNPGRLWAGLPADYVALSPDDTTAFYPAAGWVSPRALVQALMDHPLISFVGGATVEGIRCSNGRWTASDAQGRPLADAPVLVLAGAQANTRLANAIGHPGWPTQAVRGQITWFASKRGPELPVIGQGYALTLPSGDLLCGATSQAADLDPAVRDADHAVNLERLKTLTGIAPDAGAVLHGRVGWRSQTPDRLPIVGAVPLAPADLSAGTRLDQARRVPRLPGLFVLGGLGSRGLTWGPLAGEVLAAWIDGAPLPLEADLLDAIDPARWLVRAARGARAA